MLCVCGCGQETRLAPKNDRSKHWTKGQPLQCIKGHMWRGKKLSYQTGRPRTLSLDLSVFASWSPRLAYLIGLIATDGNVFDSDMKFVNNDKDLVMAVVDILHSGAKIQERIPDGSHKLSYMIDINSKALAAELARFGITARKSLTLAWPDVPLSCLPHFMRGVIDGDGSLGVYPVWHSSTYRFKIQLKTGSLLFAQGYASSVATLLNSRPPSVWPTHNPGRPTPYYNIVEQGRRAMSLATIIYANADYYSHRKRDIFIGYCQS